MRSEYTIHYTGSKVIHLPLKGQNKMTTACGREWSEWRTFAVNLGAKLPEITCKSCLKYIPKDVTWNTTTAQYVFAPGTPYGGNTSPIASSFAEVLGGENRDRFTWFPSADDDPAGILVLWDQCGRYDRFWVYTNKEN